MNERDPSGTLMHREAAQAGAVVRTQLERNRDAVKRLGAELRAMAPRAVVTCARGSSDHAATYGKYLIETRLGVLTASAAPSVTSVYKAPQDLRECLFVAISQSGGSPDILAAVEGARRDGARVLALVNEEDSPVARAAHHCLPLCAGPEESVAATKSHIASLAALAHMVASWADDAPLLEALPLAPGLLERAWALPWERAVDRLRDANHLFVIARGLGLGIAQEAALKCKEACGLHAESFSAAEVRHGPQALLSGDFPALVLSQDDAAREGIEACARELAARGVPLLVAGVQIPGAQELPTLAAHPALQPLLLVQSFYRLANALAVARGHDPDRPPHLRKVTRTL
ncbi:MAG TPA: SIS domain-containing protein [Usitatibacter sp.]|nr:SIS domain-containing protein [Usitatibacter sp.]